MTDRPIDPRTEDRITFELVRTDRKSGEAGAVGTATFENGRSTVDAPEAVAVAVRELLGRAFVDRVQADERPRGYRRSGQGIVDMLVPGMPEHFIARLRGLWLPYPDGTVVTARQQAVAHPSGPTLPDPIDVGSSTVTDPAARRVTLAETERVLNTRPIVRANPPATGLRPPAERREVNRTDCGWIV
jgi:hypothetical protein